MTKQGMIKYSVYNNKKKKKERITIVVLLLRNPLSQKQISFWDCG
jgi:hypothetical protein